jgi:hypothetical protein
MSKYKCWRSNKDKALNLICLESPEAFEALPKTVRNLGPWSSGREGELARLRLAYRLLLVEQGFCIVHAEAGKFEPEAATRVSVENANATCPDCHGDGEVDQHGGLRKKTCWRCGGRGWVRAPQPTGPQAN